MDSVELLPFLARFLSDSYVDSDANDLEELDAGVDSDADADDVDDVDEYEYADVAAKADDADPDPKYATDPDVTAAYYWPVPILYCNCRKGDSYVIV